MSELSLLVKIRSSGTSQMIEIVGSGLEETRTITSNSDILIFGCYCVVCLEIERGILARVSVEGCSNLITINSGQCKIKVAGSGNTIDATGSEVLANTTLGKSNNILTSRTNFL